MDLHKAVRQGDLDDIESAVNEGQDVNALDKSDKTPLWLAVQKGHLDACKILLSRGARLEGGRSRILELAVERGYIEIVQLLWPYCQGERQFRCLELAVSSGFHEIADFLIGKSAFEYQNPQLSDVQNLLEGGLPRRGTAAFQQWERFIFVRRSENMKLHPLFFNYALVLAANTDRNEGLRLVNILLNGENPLADANCMINVDGEIETPLINAARKGNLEILSALIERPGTDFMICDQNKWPAFLHLLTNSEAIASEQGREIAQILTKHVVADLFPFDCTGARMEIVFRNVLRFGDEPLVKKVIGLVHGAAGNVILPLLVRAQETHGLRWILNKDIEHAPKPPPILWVLLCSFIQRNPSSEAIKTFTQVAEFMVEKKIWDQSILICLVSHNFRSVKQFFFPLNEIPPKEVAEETLAGLSQALMDHTLIESWVDKGFANAALWSAIIRGRWKNPAFESLLSCPKINLDEPFPLQTTSARGEAGTLSASFPGIASGEKRKFQSRTPSDHGIRLPIDPRSLQGQVLQDYQMQLMLLEQQNKRRLMMARAEQAEPSVGEGKQAPTAGKSPLAWAVANNKTRLIEALLKSSRVDVNSQDVRKQTPLMHAISTHDCQSVEILLRTGEIDLNLPDDEGRSAIFYAVAHLTRLLTQSEKVEFSIRDCNGETVRDFAKKLGNPDVLAALCT
ncbi:hypothetical protein F1880_008358 [Penicillium rolfsii]|nr:hypothetical protein F1880_008358 [Penicillium rolfsii]